MPLNCDASVAPNPTLELVLKYKLNLSAATLRDCLAENSNFRKKIESLSWGLDERLNQNILRLAISFYENKSLEINRDLLQNHAMIQEFGGVLGSEIQVQLFPVLVRRQYNIELIKLILLEEFYCNTVYILAELGLLQNVPVYFNDPEKLAMLKNIHEIDNENIKKICLVFWAKGAFSTVEFEKIVNASKKYPLLAETLLTLDKTRTFSVPKLKKLAETPQKHQQKSILHHYAAEFKTYSLKKSSLKQLDGIELDNLSLSFKVLRDAAIKQSEYYSLALQKNNEGQLLRLFLPQLTSAPNREKVIEILYVGIKKGVVSQGQAILAITDPQLLNSAHALRERFICVKQMQDLMQDTDYKKETIALAADPDSLKAQRFRQVILQVEEQCKNVHEKLRKSKTEHEKVGKWQRADEEYRRKVYNIAYLGITNSGVDLREQLNQAEKTILNIVDPEISSLLHNVLIVIANILITCLSIGFANDLKLRKTGNYWFFNQTSSGEKIRALDKEVMSLIDASGPAPTG